MNNLEKLRDWADGTFRQAQTKQDASNGKWLIEVTVLTPIKYSGNSGWQDNPEAAATKVVEQLTLLGEDFPA